MNKSIRYLTLINTCLMVPSTSLKQAAMKTVIPHMGDDNRGGAIFRLDPSLKPQPPNLCVNCKFFKSDFPFYFNKEFGKCTQFPQVINEIDSNFFVTGVKKQKIDYQYCSIVRANENKCGQEGKFYEEK